VIICSIGSPITPASLGDNNDTIETPTEPHVASKKPLSRDQSKDDDVTSPEPVGAVAVLPGKITENWRFYNFSHFQKSFAVINAMYKRIIKQYENDMHIL